MRYMLKKGLIEVIQYLREENVRDVQYFFGKDVGRFRYFDSQNEYGVLTEEGVQLVYKGQYIARTMKGDYRIFDENELDKFYERVYE